MSLRGKRGVVLGQGAAGLTAALTMARHGVRVTSVSKVRPGGATCTIYAGGGFTLGIEGMSPEQHRAVTLETGRFLSREELLDVLCSEAPSIVSFLESVGVGFRKRRGGLSVEKDPRFPLLGGKRLIDLLHRACMAAGVELRQNLMATRILTDERGVCGLECVDYTTCSVETVPAQAVVLATGGGGCIYERTDNPQRITGDGYRLGFLAGCQLSDMEFVQFYPIGIDIPGGAHWFIDLSIIDVARVTGSKGEEFLKERLHSEGIAGGREANLLARDRCSVWISLEARNGPVLLHLEDVPRKRWEEDPYLRMIARMFPQGFPPWSGPVEVRPIQHYFPGGLVIGPSGETSLPGLFAAGEVTSGVDGANRVGGNALTSCLVFGMRAGAAAATHLKDEAISAQSGRGPTSNHSGRETPPDGGSQLPRSGLDIAVDLPRERTASEWLTLWQDGTLKPEALRKELRALTSRYLLPVRDESGLKSCIGDLERLREDLSVQSVAGSRDALLAFENLGLWYTACFVAMAALCRRESRGAHFRIDYPTERDEWKRHVVIENRLGRAVTGIS